MIVNAMRQFRKAFRNTPEGWLSKAAEGCRTPQLRLRSPLKIIQDIHATGVKTVDRLHLRGACGSLEPGCAAPAILIGDGYQSVRYRILMYIIQSRQIAFLVGQFRFPEIVPNFSAFCLVQSVDPTRRANMKMVEKFRKGFGILIRGMTHKVVMVWKHRPGFQLPAIFPSVSKEAVMQGLQFLIRIKEMFFLIRTRCHHIGSRLTQSMRRCVGPWSAVALNRFLFAPALWRIFSQNPLTRQRAGGTKAVEGHRTPYIHLPGCWHTPKVIL